MNKCVFKVVYLYFGQALQNCDATQNVILPRIHSLFDYTRKFYHLRHTYTTAQ